mmetsp:Transcript_20108/g.17806  ORF Transcript_20108/g.17806 Transcript_20108/m.17806 type:complete len:118 (-) Transcript_20108:3-356(-)
MRKDINFAEEILLNSQYQKEPLIKKLNKNLSQMINLEKTEKFLENKLKLQNKKYKIQKLRKIKNKSYLNKLKHIWNLREQAEERTVKGLWLATPKKSRYKTGKFRFLKKSQPSTHIN